MKIDRLLQQRGRVGIQCPGQPFDYIQSRSVLAAFKAADIGSVDLGTVSQFLLRKSHSFPGLPEIQRKCLTQAHATDKVALQSI